MHRCLFIPLAVLLALLTGCNRDADLPDVPDPSPLSVYSNYRAEISGHYSVVHHFIYQSAPGVWAQAAFPDTVYVSPNVMDTTAIDLYFNSQAMTLTLNLSPEFTFASELCQPGYGTERTSLSFQKNTSGCSIYYSSRYWNENNELMDQHLFDGDRLP